MSIHDSNPSDKPASMVELGSPEFLVGCVKALPWSARFALLNDPKCLHGHPQWIAAAAQAGVFGFSRTPDMMGSGTRLIQQENTPVARLVESLLWRADDNHGQTIEKDPVSGDPVPSHDFEKTCVQWSAEVHQAFSSVVDTMLKNLPKGGPRLAKRKEKRPLALGDVYFPDDDVSKTMGLLLGAACAGGSEQAAVAIATAWPAAAQVFMVNRMELLRDRLAMVTPVALAIINNQAGVLKSLADAGIDILGHAFLIDDDPLKHSPRRSAGDDLDPAKRKGMVRTVLETMASWETNLPGVYPSTAEVIVNEAIRRRAGLNLIQKTGLEGLVRTAMENNRHLAPMLERTGALFVHADAALEPLVNGIARCWRGAVSEEQKADDLALLDKVFAHVKLDKHLGDEFPVTVAMFENGNNDSRVAKELIERYVKAGRTDLITQPHQAEVDDGADVTPINVWAKKGYAELVVAAMELGADPYQPDPNSGRTAMEQAEDAHERETVHAIRAQSARQVALGALKGLDVAP